MSSNPYKELPDNAFWKRAVATRHYQNLSELWVAPDLTGKEKFATAGSCFAQHIGRHIAERGEANYLDLEQAPLFIPESERENFGYNMYTCRYGNIYTSRQLLQIAQEAMGERPISRHAWKKDGRYFDAIRPTVDPAGHDSAETVYRLRAEHLSNVAQMLKSLDVFVFTLGLTETWVDIEDGTVFPTAPGVVAGDPENDKAYYKNLSIDEIRDDLTNFWQLLTSLNSDAKMILTVSPVPLIATASGQHVLSATTYSKSVLRVAAEELASSESNIYYFPSYEIINSAAGRGYYFEPDLRSVNDNGVEFVMSHFFSGGLAKAFPKVRQYELKENGVVCDEDLIEDSLKVTEQP